LARLYLDEDFSFDIARHLQGYGHDVVTVRGLRSAGASDGTHLLRAAQDHRLLVTHNGDDFYLLHDAWLCWFRALIPPPPPVHAGILVVPQPVPKTGYWLPDYGAGEIDAFLSRGSPLTNRFFAWTPAGWMER
jgi:hypothetical protein